jgi:DNA-binding MarR family transcriptional regulator
MSDKGKIAEAIGRIALRYGLNEPETAAFAALFIEAGGGAECSLTAGEIAYLCGRSTGWARRTVRSLEEKGLVIREAQYHDPERTVRAANKFIIRAGG